MTNQQFVVRWCALHLIIKTSSIWTQQAYVLSKIKMFNNIKFSVKNNNHLFYLWYEYSMIKSNSNLKTVFVITKENGHSRTVSEGWLKKIIAFCPLHSFQQRKPVEYFDRLRCIGISLSSLRLCPDDKEGVLSTIGQ